MGWKKGIRSEYLSNTYGTYTVSVIFVVVVWLRGTPLSSESHNIASPPEHSV
jgi:hypothetical protein